MSAADPERFDDVLLNLAGQAGGIEPLFDTIFSFLYRKTDFFHIMQPGEKMGFPEGVAEKLLLRNFKRYEQGAKAAIAKREAVAKEEQAKAQKKAAAAAAAPTPIPTPTPTPAPQQSAPPQPPKPPEPAPAAAADAAEAGAPSAAPATSIDAAVNRGHLKDFVEVPYNGAATDRYTWEQTLNDVTINAKVPLGTKARDIVCVIGKSHLSLKLKGQEAIIDADYPCDARNGKEVWEKVRADECYWNVSEAKDKSHSVVSVYLEKERETWWKSAVHGEPEIDTSQVDSTRSMYDYDPETQGAIRKIMFDQDQKRKGLPQSDDLKTQDMLKAAWDAEGSPFKGTPFDPSAINMKTS